MATNKQIALAFVEEYIDRDPDFLDVVEFTDEQWPSDEDEDVLYGQVYDEVIYYLGMIRDRLEMITEE